MAEEVKRLTTTFACNDQMSKALADITKGVMGLTTNFGELKGEMTNLASIDPMQGKERGFSAVNTIQQSLISSSSELANKIGVSTTAQELFTGAIHGSNVAMKGLMLTLAPLGVMVGALYATLGSMDKVDYFTSLQSRLKLITGDASKVDDINNQIYASAQRARGSYSEMADNVSKLGLLAGHAFNNTSEMVVFVEQLQKQFKIAGAGAQEASSAMYQLTQAMASGRLQGDEFRSIMENAPMLAQAIAKEMDVPISKMRELSSEGAITSDIIRKALTNESAMAEVNAQFESIPMKFSEMITSLSNVATTSFGDVFQKIGGALNSDGMEKILSIATVGIKTFASVTSGALDVIATLGGIISWTAGAFESLASIVIGVAPIAIEALITVASVYLGYLIGINAQWVIAGALLVPSMVAMATMTAIYWAMNGAMAVKNGLLATYNTLTSFARIKTIALTGATRLFNLVLMANPLGIIIGLVAGVIGVFALLHLRTVNLRETFASAWESIAMGAGGAINYVIDKLNVLIDLINKGGKAFGAIFGFEYKEIEAVAKVDPTGIAQKGAEFIRTAKWDDILGVIKPNIELPQMGAIEESTKSIAESTKGIKDSLDENFASVDELRQLALGDGVSNITRQDIKIEVVNHNNVNSELDIDGIGDTIAQSLFKAVNVNRNGV